MGFWGSLFGGSNPTLNQGIKQAGQTSTWANIKGQGLTNQAGGFFSGLMSGDPAQQAKILAPQIATQQKQGQQQKQTMAQFGNRSGGTNAAAQNIDDTTRANIGKMISDLTMQGAQAGASMGQNLVDTGLTALGQQAQMSQQQMQNWSDSILGGAVAQGVGAAMSFIPTGG